jgi:predicted Kef-type K+ transport protein
MFMRSWASRIIAALALLICLICPLVETFDYWDHTIQTGNDTEYTLVVLALCLGVAYSFARFIFKSALVGFVANSVFASCAQKSFFSATRCLTLLLFDATSPPPLSLRI